MKMDMMKKKYIAPSIEVVEMEELCLVSASIQDGDSLGGGGGTGSGGGNFDEEYDEELSNRRRNYWNEVGGW